MSESSFPIVGADFTSGQWSQVLEGLGNGVLDDWGNPYAITLFSNDTATIAVSTVSGVAEAVVAGFGHRLTATVTLSIPAVGSPTTYNIGLLYDPASAANPVLLTVLTGTVTLTTGQVWLPLYVIVRQPSQALTAAVLTTPLLKVQPRAITPSQAALLAVPPKTYLVGTAVFCADTANTYVATLVGSTPTWVQVGGGGLTPIVPSSVAGTGVTVGANGVVTFTAATAISLNGIFSTRFDNYLILFDQPSGSTVAGGTLRLRAGGTDDTGGNYSYQQSWAAAAVLTANNAGGVAQWGAFPVSGVEASAEWKLFDPALAKPTRVQIHAEMWSNSTTGVDSSMSGRHNLSTAYDGITYTPSAGNITGTMRVYGYNNN